MKTGLFVSVCYILVTAGAFADSYSINVQTGLNIIANQLDHGCGCTNGCCCLCDAIASAPDGIVLYKYDNTNRTWESASYSAALGTWVPDNFKIYPGDGAFLYSPTNFTLTITGTPVVPVLPVNIPSGACYLLANQTNSVGTYENIVGLPPTNGATIYEWNGSNYNSFTYQSGPGSWVDASSNVVSEPTVPVGEAVWISSDGTPPPAGAQTYTLNLPPGSSIIANQLDHGSNTLDEVLAGVPDRTSLLKWDCASGTFTSYAYRTLSGWNPETTLAPGEAGIIQIPGASGVALTFSGIPHVPVLPATLPCGAGHYYLLSRQTNDTGTYENITGLAPQEGAEVQVLAGGGFATNTFTGGSWSLGTPSLGIGQGALFYIPNSPPSYSVSIQPGLNLIANQLDHGSNTLDEIMPSAPDGCVLYKYDNSGSNWEASYYSTTLSNWVPDNITLNPGEGAFLQSPTNFTLTFTGTPHVPVLPVTIPTGACYLLSRQTNDIGTYENIAGTVPADGARVYKWNGSNYNSFMYESGLGGWVDSSSNSVPEPTVAEGKALWISPSTGTPVPIEVAPIFTSQPSSTTVAQGYPATFDVSVAGTTPLTYQWRFNGVDIPGATNSGYIINSTTPGDAGTYDVVASNSSGSKTSNAAELTVEPLGSQCCDSRQWSQSQPTGSIPSARRGYAIANDSLPSLILFGGQDISDPQQDTWRWDGGGWFNVSPSLVNPPARWKHAMAYDSQRLKTVLFGGLTTNGSTLADTWEWDGVSWNNSTPPNANDSPTARYGHAMAYDAQNHVVVLFGGKDSNGNLLNDTWIWNGSVWTEVTPADPAMSPSPRCGHAMVYDSSIGRIVLYGGQTNATDSTSLSDETWEWDGTKWINVTTYPNPGGRSDFAMTYDPDCGRIVLFGGYTPASTADTWERTGETWAPVSLSSTPAARAENAAAYYGPRQQVIIFGGNIADNSLSIPQVTNDTWNFAYNANPINNGILRTDVISVGPPQDAWHRVLVTRRFSWANIGDTVGLGDHAFNYFVFAKSDIWDTFRAGTFPSSGIYTQHRAKRRCADDYTICPDCAKNNGCIYTSTDCHWQYENAWLYDDYAVGAGNFCNPLVVYMDFYDYDRPWKNAVVASAHAAAGLVECGAAILASPIDWWAVGSACVGAAADAIDAEETIADDINSVPDQNMKRVGSLHANGLDSAFFSSPTDPNPPTFLECRQDRYDRKGPSTPNQLVDTIRNGAGRVETQWILQQVGKGVSDGFMDPCAGPGTNSVCEIGYFAFAQINGAELLFKLRVAGPSLSNVGQLLDGPREFIFAVDADNNPSTGDPCWPLCGADYYVSIVQAASSDQKSVINTGRIYRWDPCATPASCNGSASGEWELQPDQPYDIAVRQTMLQARASLQALGNPLGYFSVWAVSRTSSLTNSFTNQVCSTMPDDPCNKRMQLGRQPDTICPQVVGVNFFQVATGALTAPITVSFTEPMQPISASNIVFDPPQAFSVSLDPVKHSLLSVNPVGQWQPGHYTVTLLPAIKDYSGNALDGQGDGTCNTAYSFDFCVPDVNFEVTDSNGVPEQEFTQGENIYAEGSGFPPNDTFALYLVRRNNLEDSTKFLADWSDRASIAVTTDAGGNLPLTDLGVPVLAGNYKLVADLNGNGYYDSSDRVFDLCGVGLKYGSPCESALEDIAAWWPFEGVSSGGLIINELVDANHGIVTGNPLTTVQGVVGNAKSFDGLTYISVPDDSGSLYPELNFGSDDFSIELWIKPAQTTAEMPLVDKRTPGPNANFTGYYLYVRNGTLNFQIGGVGGSGVATFTGPSVPDDGNWHHVAVTVSNQTPEQPGAVWLYVDGNGTLGGNLADVYDVDNTAELRIGANRSGDSNPSYYSGAMDELTLYDRALDPDEVRFIYDQNAQGKCTDGLGPQITNQPASSSVVFVNHPTTISVQAGNPLDYAGFAISYQWYLNGIALTNNSIVSGATTATLTLNNASLAYAGNYTVVVGNVAGSVTSTPTTLAVLNPPILSSPSISSNQMFQFNLYSYANTNYVIEASSNLTTWFPVMTLLNATGQVQLSVTNPPGSGHYFFRGRVEP